MLQRRSRKCNIDPGQLWTVIGMVFGKQQLQRPYSGRNDFPGGRCTFIFRQSLIQSSTLTVVETS